MSNQRTKKTMGSQGNFHVLEEGWQNLKKKLGFNCARNEPCGY
jgi:hypothetical protein